METIAMRVEALRLWMKREGLDAYIVPTADPHGSEYLPDYWKCREWLTGFTGSAGTAVVTLGGAALWTDSRYFIQAAEECAGTPFLLMREGEKATPTIGAWLAGQAGVQEVGATALLVSESFGKEVESAAHGVSLHFHYTADPFAELWTMRPPLPRAHVTPQNAAYVGQQVEEKRTLLTAGIGENGILLLTDLAQIAWTLNLRGSDIAYNPVFLAYLFLHKGGGTLCVDTDKLTAETLGHLKGAGIGVRTYEEVTDVVSEMEATERHTWYMYKGPSAFFSQLFSACGIKLHEVDSLAESLKAIKDEREKQGFRTAMERDGVALVQFRRWLDETLASGKRLTEQAIDCKLTERRAAMEGFESLSFGTIAAAGPHGAIVHYEANPSLENVLPENGLLLLDSGAQYDCGTTDITRTIPLGELTAEEKKVYTLVMKAHIGLARLRFPEGTNGLQADTAARAPLWQAGLDFGHGTGHGVGSHLCVHEGPHQVRKDKRPCTSVALQEGMTITDEPGIYLEGKFGVRLENVLLIRKDDDGFLSFEALTLCPFDTKPLQTELLTHEERAYLNAYHQEVRERLLPLLTDEGDRRWLIGATTAL